MIKVKNVILVLYTAYLFSLFVLIESAETYLISKLIFAITVAFSLFVLLRKHRGIKMSRPTVSICIFTLLCFISCIYSQVPQVSLEMSITMAQLSVMLVIFENTLREHLSVDTFVNIILIAGFAMCLLLIAFYGFGTYLEAIRGNGRIGSDFENVNTIGGSAAYVALACWYKVLYEKKKIYLGVILVPVIIILGAGSRTAILIALIGIITMSICYVNSMKGSKKIKYGLFAVLVLIVILVLAPSFRQLSFLNSTFERFDVMIASMTGKTTQLGSTVYRIKMIDVGWDMFLYSPIWGNGINGTRIWLQSSGVPYTVLHNNYIELLADLGVLGFIAYYYVYVWMLKTLTKRVVDIRIKGLCFSLIAMMLVLDIGGVVYYQQRQYFLFSAMIALCISGGLVKSGQGRR